MVSLQNKILTKAGHHHDGIPRATSNENLNYFFFNFSRGLRSMCLKKVEIVSSHVCWRVGCREPSDEL